jgi:hypothetical protein
MIKPVPCQFNFVSTNINWFLSTGRVCGNGFKLPLFYLIMLPPQLLTGPGKAGIDHLVARRFDYV